MKKEPGVAVGLVIILINIVWFAAIVSLEYSPVGPYKGMKWILTGLQTQFLAVLCLISNQYYGKSFIFRFWVKLTLNGFRLRCNNVHYVHFALFFIAGTYVFLIGLLSGARP